MKLRVEGELFQYIKVPSCQECNSVASDEPHTNLLDRSQYVKDHLAQKYRRAMKFPDWEDEEIEQLGHRLRQMVEAAMRYKYLVVYRLEYGMGGRYKLKDYGYLSFDPQKIGQFADAGKWDEVVRQAEQLPSNWEDGLPTGKPRTQFFSDYQSAKLFVSSIGLSSSSEYGAWWHNNPESRSINGLHSYPRSYYGEAWLGWADYLGPSYAPKIEWVDYETAKAFVYSLGLHSQSEFAGWCRSHKEKRLDLRIPTSPKKIYAGEWEGWESFLGIPIAESDQWLSYEEATICVRKLGLRSSTDYAKWFKEHKEERLALRLPRLPPISYINRWQGWRAFLDKND